MTTNIYVNNFSASNEQALINNLTREVVQMWGFDFYYLPRTFGNLDNLLGEDRISIFDKYYVIEMYIDSVNNFGNMGDLITKFGAEMRDDISLSVHRDEFKLRTGMIRPFEGDLIWFEKSKGLFEVKYVDHENPFYQLGRLLQFKMTCELFQYSNERLRTGIAEIDAIETEYKNVNDPTPDIGVSDNTLIQTEADAINDFDETSPFGDY